jgi:trimethylamine:corrinoid methyltransferase-like protein
MANIKTTFLTKSEEDFIHAKSIECLKEVGVRVDSESVLEMLEKKGASVDYENFIAKIPEKVIDESL